MNIAKDALNIAKDAMNIFFVFFLAWIYVHFWSTVFGKSDGGQLAQTAVGLLVLCIRRKELLTATWGEICMFNVSLEISLSLSQTDFTESREQTRTEVVFRKLSLPFPAHGGFQLNMCGICTDLPHEAVKPKQFFPLPLQPMLFFMYRNSALDF